MADLTRHEQFAQSAMVALIARAPADEAINPYDLADEAHNIASLIEARLLERDLRQAAERRKAA